MSTYSEMVVKLEVFTRQLEAQLARVALAFAPLLETFTRFGATLSPPYRVKRGRGQRRNRRHK